MTIAAGQPALASDVLTAVANAGTPIVTTIAALRALTSTTTATSILVSGYYAAGDGGGGVFVVRSSDTTSSDNGGTVIVDAASRRWYRIFSDHVTVLMFGAKGDGTTDDAPAFRAALSANVAPVIVPGFGRTYVFNTVVASPYADLLQTGVLLSSLNGFRLIGNGNPIITLGNSVAASEIFLISQCNDFEVRGLTLRGNRSGIASTVENPGFALMSCKNFLFSHLHFTGNFGGEGSMFAGDWLVNGKWENIVGDAVGIGFDTAFLLNCDFVNCTATGSGADGTASGTSVGDRFWSQIYDPPSINYNTTGVSFTSTSRVRVINCSGTNFNIGAFITSGTDIHLDGCQFLGNPGAAGGSGGYGIYIGYYGSGSFPSTGFPPGRVTIEECQCSSNGAANPGAGILIDGSQITNSDVISDVLIDDCAIIYNNGFGVNVTGQVHVNDVRIIDSLITGNSNQISASILSGMVTNSNPYGAVLRNNPTINPIGYGITPTLPSAVGSGNAVTNTTPVYATITIFQQTFAYSVNVISPSGGTTAPFGTIAANTGPFTFRMAPGYAVWFGTAVPLGWAWYGE